MNEKSKSRMYKKIAKAVEDLADDFDSVQIFLTKHVKINKLHEDTESYHYGCGNKFASYGQIKTWIKSEEKAYEMMMENQGGDQNGDGEDGSIEN